MTWASSLTFDLPSKLQPTDAAAAADVSSMDITCGHRKEKVHSGNLSLLLIQVGENPLLTNGSILIQEEIWIPDVC